LLTDKWGSVWAVGDFDRDGLSDILVRGWIPNHYPIIGLIGVLESPDSFSYPTQEVWEDTIGGCSDNPNSVFDIDNDGIIEIFHNEDESYCFGIRKSVGNNQYATVYETNPDTFPGDDPYSTHACGDFDGDGKNEFVMSGSSGYYWVYEYDPDLGYHEVLCDYIHTGNERDCQTIPGWPGERPHFLIKGTNYATGHIQAFIFKAIADNTYQVVKTFDFPYPYMECYHGFSSAGDLDGDGVAELALEAIPWVYIIKQAGNDSFYIWDRVSGSETGASTRILDVDHDGLNDLVVSGNNETKIYEYSPGNVDENKSGFPISHGIQLSVYPNPVRSQCMIDYTLTKPTEVHLALYDACGRLVKLLEKNHKDAGVYRHAVQFDDLTPGVYFLKLTTEAGSTVRKIIRMR